MTHSHCVTARLGGSHVSPHGHTRISHEISIHLQRTIPRPPGQRLISHEILTCKAQSPQRHMPGGKALERLGVGGGSKNFRPKHGGTHPPTTERTHLYDRHPPRDAGRSICQSETSRLPLLGNMGARRPEKQTNDNHNKQREATTGTPTHGETSRHASCGNS